MSPPLILKSGDKSPQHAVRGCILELAVCALTCGEADEGEMGQEMERRGRLLI